ncbi:hypothetical protein CLOM_g19087 [Closterium sp. NIES-68]|nr:hypothetical protein CLOM_g19087 [Closterium sp. NIES-68]GJP75112.1 hypothetical protein CLOP_g5600 [Closterium sp. NIES-67]
MCSHEGTSGSSGANSSTVNVFVTGQPGIGKTSLVLKVAKRLPQHLVAGFYTVEAKAEGTGERLGLDVITFAGERAPLCRLRRGCGPKIGKYYVAIDEFERVVLPHLMPSDNTRLHIVDEIGRMELCSDKFRDAVLNLLASPVAVFGALPAPRYGHTLELVEEIKQRADTAVLTLTKANRDATAVQIEELLTRLIKEGERGAGEGLGGEGEDAGGEEGAGNEGEGESNIGAGGSNLGYGGVRGAGPDGVNALSAAGASASAGLGTGAPGSGLANGGSGLGINHVLAAVQAHAANADLFDGAHTVHG